jgi:peptidoglycan hydrolase CwlO-like protein
MKNIKDDASSRTNKFVKTLNAHPVWRNIGLATIALLVGWSMGAMRGGAPSASSEIENRQLKMQVRKLEQETHALQAQVGDYKTLQQVQQDMIEQLRSGNQKLQNRLYSVQEEVQQYQEKLGM